MHAKNYRHIRELKPNIKYFSRPSIRWLSKSSRRWDETSTLNWFRCKAEESRTDNNWRRVFTVGKGLLGAGHNSVFLWTILRTEKWARTSMSRTRAHRRHRQSSCFFEYTENFSKNNHGGIAHRKVEPNVVTHYANIENPKRYLIELFRKYRLCNSAGIDGYKTNHSLRNSTLPEWCRRAANNVENRLQEYRGCTSLQKDMHRANTKRLKGPQWSYKWSKV